MTSLDPIEGFNTLSSQAQSQSQAGPARFIAPTHSIEPVETTTREPVKSTTVKSTKRRDRNIKKINKPLSHSHSHAPIPTGYEKRFYRPDYDALERVQKEEVGVLKWEDDGRYGMSPLSLTSSSYSLAPLPPPGLWVTVCTPFRRLSLRSGATVFPRLSHSRPRQR